MWQQGQRPPKTQIGRFGTDAERFALRFEIPVLKRKVNIGAFRHTAGVIQKILSADVPRFY